jgi:hypothetical protein
MYDTILAWAGFALALLFLLPFAGTRKLLLEVFTWALRLALLALLAGGAVLWFRPDLLPAEVSTTLDYVPPWLSNILPPVESRNFGLVVAASLTAVFLPLLAVLDVTRKLAGWRLRRLRKLADAAPTLLVASGPAPVAAPEPPRRRADRQSAADTLAEVGSRKPYRVADQA